MNKFNVCIGLIVVFFVVFLGMRNPWLDSKPGGPKPKARAVITQTASKNLVTSCLQSCNDTHHSTPLALLLTTTIQENTLFARALPVTDDQTAIVQSALSRRSSRAPPALIT